ncbi:MAG: ferritin [bacterium]|nr:ferritin [bacterium]
MIKKKMQDAFNKQIGEEYYSSYLYLSMAAYFDSISLKGFAGWMKFQVQEEMLHAMKFYNQIIDRGGAVELPHIEEPKRTWESPLNAFEDGLAHEENISGCINKLMDLAVEERDYAAQNLLKWFIDEQVEEEDNFNEVIDKLQMIGDHKPSLLLEDKEMGLRAGTINPFAAAPAEE